jgi:hypothetical protein
MTETKRFLKRYYQNPLPIPQWRREPVRVAGHRRGGRYFLTINNETRAVSRRRYEGAWMLVGYTSGYGSRPTLSEALPLAFHGFWQAGDQGARHRIKVACQSIIHAKETQDGESTDNS